MQTCSCGLSAVKRVTKKFHLAQGDELAVFSNLNFEIEADRFVTILGPSGCGKSTLLRMIAGLEIPDEGQIVLDGGTAASRPRVGFMLQQYPSLPWLTVGQNVALALDSQNVTRDKIRSRERALYYLSRVGLFGWQDAYPHELSGGMLQRLALARTLAMEPEIVLLDEPLGALDALTRRDLQSLIHDLHKAEPRTFVMITHDVDEALAVADRIIVLGPSGTGILHDSATSDLRLDRNALVRLLQQTRVTFAAGTWSGYSTVREAVTRNRTQGYDFWLGMADQEQVAALRSGRAVGAFFSVPSLVQMSEELADLDPVIVHVFSRPASSTSCERILINPRRGRNALQWAVFGEGLDTAIVRRVDHDACPHRVTRYPDRSACIRAVIRGEADACLADHISVAHLVSWWQRRRLSWRPLPDDIWPDLWIVLVVPRQLITERGDLLGYAVRALAHDATAIQRRGGEEMKFFDVESSIQMLQDGTIETAFNRWGGKQLPVDPNLIGNLRSPKA